MSRKWTHEELCERARRWLAGTRKCKPVFSNIGSCREIPDAIGWSSCHQWKGSTVIECKVSVDDFRGDHRKYTTYRSPEGYTFRPGQVSRKFAEEHGYERVTIPNMGDYRFMMVPLGLITQEMLRKYSPDHGLLLVDGKVIWKAVDAPRREVVDKDAEIRYLRFAIINGKSEFQYTNTNVQESEICSFA